jgi:hypothetical protein
MTTGQEFRDFVRSIRVLRTQEKLSRGQVKLRTLFGSESLGSSAVCFNSWDVRAWKTWVEISFPAERAKFDLLRSITRRLVRGFAPGAEWVYMRHCAGALVLLRNQKIIVIDRTGARVFHILREGFCTDRGLLASEVQARQILPRWTISVLHAETEKPPYFIVQAYIRHRLKTWREWLPRFSEVLEVLFKYYSNFGFRETVAADYLNQLAVTCHEQLRAMTGNEARGLGELLDRILAQCRTRIARSGPGRTWLTRVHGDFIAAHIVICPRENDHDDFVLTDWSESHEYSVFHDLFYFHFQNHESDFVEYILEFQPEMLRCRFDDGAELLARQFRERWGCELSAEFLQLNFLVCFVQELEHRLCRLRGEAVDFWASQAARMLKGNS